jgi:inosose dehydratase
LALDTGHCAYAGWDPIEALDTWRWRVRHVTVQDLDPAVRDVALRHGLDQREAIRRKIFPALGAGKLDLAGVAAKLAELDYDGWLVAEQEGAGVPARDAATANRAALAQLFPA